MKKFLKKSLAVLLVMVLTLSAAPLSGFVGLELPEWLGFSIISSAATYSGKCGANVSWAVYPSSGVLNITGSGAMDDYTYYAYAPWYYYASYIRTVNISDNVTTIGDNAFASCSNLTNVTIGNDVKEIGVSAFWNCPNLSNLTIGDSVSVIGYGAFEWCKSLTQVIIPDSVKNIGDYAFFSCSKLKNLTIGNRVTTIGELAFHGCGITNLRIPASVTSIGAKSFSACHDLTNITVDSSNKYYSSNSDGVLFNKDKTELILYPIGNARTSYSFPESVTCISDYAFYYSNLKSLTIPDKITSVGDYAFCASQSLQSVTIGEGVTTIGDHTFNFCPKLTELTIGKNVTTIDCYAFGDCNNLESVILPDELKTIKMGAFGGCDNLKNILIPNSVTCIESGAFSSCGSLEYVHIPSSLKSIEEDILYNSSAYVCSTTEDCYAKKYADANGIEFKKCNGHSFAIFTTSKSYTVEPGKSMGLAFGYMKDNKLDGEWKKMAITVSDPTIVSISDYQKTDFGYAIDVFGKKVGQTNLTITDAETGLNTVITVTVSDTFAKTYSYDINNMPSFYPNNKFENNIQTNIYNVNGIYINNFSSKKNETTGKYRVSFNAYNEQNHAAAVDIFDAQGKWLRSEKIKKYVGMPESIYDTGKEVFYLFTNWEWASYIHPMHSQKTEVTFEVPDGGYFEISNNFADSPGCYLYNSIDIFFTGLMLVNDLISFDTEALFEEEIVEKISEDEDVREKFIDVYTSTIVNEVRKDCQNMTEASFNNSYYDISVTFEEFLKLANIDIEDVLEVSCGLGESVFTTLSGPISIGLEGCFLISKGTNLYIQGLDMGWSVDEPYVRVYTNPTEGMINPQGVYVDTNGNVDAETVLQVFRISNDDSVKVVLDSDNPLEMHELYNISFVKNDENVQPNGKVKVHVPIPEGMDSDTAKIYRQEENGSWTILNAKVEGNYLVFETDHFSLYAIVGDKAELEITQLPTKLTYDIGDDIDITDISVEIKGNDISSGYIISPAVAYKVGTQEITVTYAGVSTTFEITVFPKTPEIVEPSTTTIKYGDTLKLKLDDFAIPEGCTVQWSVEGEYFTMTTNEDGSECYLTSDKTGTSTVTVKLVDENGDVLTDTDGNELSDQIELESKAGFFMKIRSFFRNLFGSSRIVE